VLYKPSWFLFIAAGGGGGARIFFNLINTKDREKKKKGRGKFKRKRRQGEGEGRYPGVLFLLIDLGMGDKRSFPSLHSHREEGGKRKKKTETKMGEKKKGGKALWSWISRVPGKGRKSHPHLLPVWANARSWPIACGNSAHEKKEKR